MPSSESSSLASHLVILYHSYLLTKRILRNANAQVLLLTLCSTFKESLSNRLQQSLLQLSDAALAVLVLYCFQDC